MVNPQKHFSCRIWSLHRCYQEQPGSLKCL